jgi:hypothetical protein
MCKLLYILGLKFECRRDISNVKKILNIKRENEKYLGKPERILRRISYRIIPYNQKRTRKN